MSQFGARDLLVIARSVLLDALDALSDQREALILIGAQAIYIHTKAAPVALPETTKDSDIAIDRRALSDDPRLELALERAGFMLGDQPGSWRGRLGVPVDLMTPAGMADPGGTRGARMPPRSHHATRRTAGLEPAVVDYSHLAMSALDESDPRTFTVKVAGPAALIVAKMHKLGERQAQSPHRLLDKDAHDVYRLLRGVPTQSLVFPGHVYVRA